MGAVTASLILADALVREGKYVQAIPEFGPERRGAPVRAYNRISQRPIRLRSGITEPDAVVVIDPGFSTNPMVLEGLSPEGVILVNSALSPQEIWERLSPDESRTLWVVDATRIAMEEFGRNIPNTPVLGALAKALGEWVSLDSLRDALSSRFGGKGQAVMEANLRALERAYQEVVRYEA